MYRIALYPVIAAVALSGFLGGRWLELSGVLHRLLERGGTAVGVPEDVFRGPPGQPPPEARKGSGVQRGGRTSPSLKDPSKDRRPPTQTKTSAPSPQGAKTSSPPQTPTKTSSAPLTQRSSPTGG